MLDFPPLLKEMNEIDAGFKYHGVGSVYFVFLMLPPQMRLFQSRL